MTRKIAQCGTRSGYNRHLRLKEKACEPCLESNRIPVNNRYKNNEEYRKKQIANQIKNRRERRKNDPEYALKEKATRKKINNKRWLNSEFKEISRQHRLKRRTRLAGVEQIPYTEKEVINKYGTNCHICNKPIDLKAPRQTGKKGCENGLHIDHVIPIAKGGNDTLNNVKPAHGKCNVLKGAK